jgi:hypothetical protein
MHGVHRRKGRVRGAEKRTKVSAACGLTPVEQDVAGMMRLQRTKARLSGEDVTGRGEEKSLPNG